MQFVLLFYKLRLKNSFTGSPLQSAFLICLLKPAFATTGPPKQIGKYESIWLFLFFKFVLGSR